MPLSDRPNIILITTDQHRYDSIGCAGHPLLRTPHIDRLAREGIRFDRAYVANPICAPTRASILTGRYPHEHGVVANLIDMGAGETTFVQLLNSAGYYTAAVGHVQAFPPGEPFGFQYVDAVYQKHGVRDNYRRYLKTKGLAGLEVQAKGEKLPFEVYTSALDAEDYSDSYVGRKAVQFIDENKERPFMAWIGFCGPHFPFDPPEPYDRMYDPQEVPMPPKVAGDLDGKPAMQDWHRIMGYEKLSDDMIRKIRANYYGNITLIDEWIGRILETLERNNLRKNTLVLLTADHGELLGDHGLLWKCEHGMYEASVRVPFILSLPGESGGGQVRSEFVESVDIAPTFLDACGLDLPAQMQGRSLLSLLQGRSDGWREAAFCEGRSIQTREGLPYDDPNLSVVMIRTDRWKYIYHRNEEAFCELYDLQHDPNECHNLIRCSEHAAIVSKLREKILLWRFDTQRPLHGYVCETFDEQMNRPLKTDPPQDGITWAKP